MSITRRQQQRNLYHNSSISKLPRELISLVFLEVKNNAIESLGKIEDRALAINNWVVVSHVCHAWKGIALSCLELWATIFITPKVFEWARELFRRSRGHSFDLYISIRTETAPLEKAAMVFVEKTVLKNMGRCRSFTSSGISSAIVSRLLASTTATRLRSIDVTFYAFSHFPFFPPERENFVLDCSSQSLSALTKLAVSGCALRYGTGDLLKLTHLELRYLVKDRETPSPSCRRLLETLSSIPNLRHLALQRVMVGFDGQSLCLPGDPKLQFRALQYFEVVGSNAEVHGILGSVLIPHSCRLSIQATHSIREPNLQIQFFDSIIETISSFQLSLPTSRLEPPKSVRFIFGPFECQFKFEVFREDVPTPYQPVESHATPPTATFSFGYYRESGVVTSFETSTIRPLLALVELHQVVTLEIVGLHDQRYWPFYSKEIDVCRYLDILINDLDSSENVSAPPKCTCDSEEEICHWTPRFPSLKNINILRTDDSYTFRVDQAFLKRMRAAMGRRLKHDRLPSPHLRLPLEFNKVPRVKLGSMVDDCVFVKSFNGIT